MILEGRFREKSICMWSCVFLSSSLLHLPCQVILQHVYKNYAFWSKFCSSSFCLRHIFLWFEMDKNVC